MNLTPKKFEQLIKKYQRQKNKANYNNVKKFVNAVTRESNLRLKALEQSAYDYGAYSYAVNYTDISYGTKRFKWAGSFNDIEDTIEQTRVGMQFLSRKSSTVIGQQDIEKNRFNSLRDDFDVFKNIDDITLKKFVQFIGRTEQASAFLNQYGNSKVAMVYLFDAWSSHRNNEQQLLHALDNFFLGEKGLYETLNDLGIDYTSNRYSGYDWRNYKY